MKETTWGSRNAEDMFRVATRLANFDPTELMLEIHRRSPHGARVNEPTVLQAMQTIYDRYHEAKKENEMREKEKAHATACRAARKILAHEIQMHAIGEAMDAHIGFDAPPYYKPTRERLEAAFRKLGITAEDLDAYLDTCTRKEAAKISWDDHYPTPLAHDERGMLGQIFGLE